MQTPVVCRRRGLCPSDSARHIRDPSGELKQAWGDNFRGALELTLAVESDNEFLWFTDQSIRAVGKHLLAGTRAVTMKQAGSMPHVLI